MLTLKISELKKQSAVELQATLDKTLAAMLYPYDDPTYDNGPFLVNIVDDIGTTSLGGAGNLVALRYVWFLYKKATIPGYEHEHSPSWYEKPVVEL